MRTITLFESDDDERYYWPLLWFRVCMYTRVNILFVDGENVIISSVDHYLDK